MSETERQHTTQLIKASREGDEEAKRELFGRVYDELRRIAQRRVGWGKYGHTMQATAFANEAYIFFEKHFPVPPKDQPENRETFFRIAALAMRAILKDYWRAKNTEKRGGGSEPVPLEHDVSEPAHADFEQVDFLALDEAMTRLEGRNGRWFCAVMHRYFGGRTIAETAELMNLSAATVKTDWLLARGWLRKELDIGGDHDGGA